MTGRIGRLRRAETIERAGSRLRLRSLAWGLQAVRRSTSQHSRESVAGKSKTRAAEICITEYV